MTLRQASASDLPRLVELWLEMMEEHHAFEPRMVLTSVAPATYRTYLQLHLQSPRSMVVLDEADGETRGFCCAYVCQNLPMFAPAEFGYVSDLAVAAPYRGRGIGTELLEHVKKWFRSFGIECLQLQVYSNNERGREFWKSKGFTCYVERHWLDL